MDTALSTVLSTRMPHEEEEAHVMKHCSTHPVSNTAQDLWAGSYQDASTSLRGRRPPRGGSKDKLRLVVCNGRGRVARAHRRRGSRASRCSCQQELSTARPCRTNASRASVGLALLAPSQTNEWLSVSGAAGIGTRRARIACTIATTSAVIVGQCQTAVLVWTGHCPAPPPANKPGLGNLTWM